MSTRGLSLMFIALGSAVKCFVLGSWNCCGIHCRDLGFDFVWSSDLLKSSDCLGVQWMRVCSTCQWALVISIRWKKSLEKLIYLDWLFIDNLVISNPEQNLFKIMGSFFRSGRNDCFTKIVIGFAAVLGLMSYGVVTIVNLYMLS